MPNFVLKITDVGVIETDKMILLAVVLNLSYTLWRNLLRRDYKTPQAYKNEINSPLFMCHRILIAALSAHAAELLVLSFFSDDVSK